MLEVAAATLGNTFFGIDRACLLFRHKREKVYVAADTAAECEAHGTALIELARRHGLTMLKINNLLYSAALSHIDTAPVDLEAEQFVFRAEWNELGEVPDVADNVGAYKASIACQRDAELCGKWLATGASLRQLLAISDNQARWCQFWATRDADPRVRLGHAAGLAEHDRIAEANTERLQKILERRGAGNGKQH
jgi:hypothetical protein